MKLKPLFILLLIIVSVLCISSASAEAIDLDYNDTGSLEAPVIGDNDLNENKNDVRIPTETPGIYTNDLTKHFRNESQFEVKVIGEDGYPVGEGALVDFTIKKVTYSLPTDEKGIATLPINLIPGTYEITAKYGSYVKTNKVNVLPPIVTNDLVTYYKGNEPFSATILGNDGKPISTAARVDFVIKEKTYTRYTSNGVASLPIGLHIGNWKITVKYGKYSVTNNIIIKNPIVTANLVKDFRDSRGFEATIHSTSNKTVGEGKAVKFTIGKTTYTRYTDENGTATLPIGLKTGTWQITTNYADLSVSNTIKVLPYVSTQDIVKYYNNEPSTFDVFVGGADGTPSAGIKVTIVANGVTYSKTTDKNGLATIPINFKLGNYTITTKCGEKTLTNNLEIRPTVLTDDRTMYHKCNQSFMATALDSNGNPVGEGEKVDFIIGKSTYTRYTDKNGTASIQIGLNPGNWQITTVYNKCSIANRIIVLSRLSPVEGNVETTYGTPKEFQVKLVDSTGKPFANQNVTFNVSGIEIINQTDDDGIATIGLNLTAGNYVIEYSADGITNKNTYTVKNFITLKAFKWGSKGDVTKNKVLMNNIKRTPLINQIIEAAKIGTPFLTIKGGEGDPIFITAGTHGNELPSQVAILKLITSLETTPVTGTVYIIPFLCPKITELNIRRFNGDDLNRVAHITNKVSNRVLTVMIQLNCTYYADFHSTQSPGIPGKDVIMGCASPTDTTDMVKSIANMSGVGTIIYKEAGDPYYGAIQDHANMAGIPSITCEVVSVPGSLDKNSDVKSLKQMNAYLKYTGMIA
ncbi:MAG: succinylglutamate desuccinylase/aspartoacylase family protein [Methanobrevibacter sp.]|uniref:succinylglutamate desuccinylase/aspartoacylase domain-containing protein n=1 Tax=Methanobrevibacter sp. TaxID=66852 RepID=UPI0026E0263D|nr:succinylglutamate desuccinylase/aspartoacylase family protein [Methanobrevibacter sp.]MDO5849498.1 succinylglutamate desuccinylase/aspartoacylase family protein [Methanobrevibacter sp.]